MVSYLLIYSLNCLNTKNLQTLTFFVGLGKNFRYNFKFGKKFEIYSIYSVYKFFNKNNLTESLLIKYYAIASLVVQEDNRDIKMDFLAGTTTNRWETKWAADPTEVFGNRPSLVPSSVYSPLREEQSQ